MGNDFTDKELKAASWWVQHRMTVRRAGIGALVAIDVAVCFFAIFGLVRYFLIDYTKSERLLRELAEPLINPAVIEARQPRPLDLKPVAILAAGANRYDLVAFVKNSNAVWYATYDAVFRTETDIIKTVPSVALPGMEAPVTALGIQSVARLRGVRVEIHNLHWARARLTGNEIRDRLQFSVSDAKFAPAPSGSREPSRATFTVTNASAYNYWTVRFTVVLRRGVAIAGVNTVELAQVRSGEPREASAAWFETLNAPTKVEVYPEVNIFDPGAYMPPGR